MQVLALRACIQKVSRQVRNQQVLAAIDHGTGTLGHCSPEYVPMQWMANPVADHQSGRR